MMQLKLKRSQREGGILSSNAIFCLDARVEFTTPEQQNIRRYKLAKQVIYSSEASKRHLERAAEHHSQGSTSGYLKSIGSIAMAAMRLNISIESLTRGQHIECKSLDELLGAEDAIMTACQNLKGYLATAATFDGREVVVDFAEGEPRIIAHATTPDPTLVAPRRAASASAPIAQLTTTSVYEESSDLEDAEWRDLSQPESQFSLDPILAYLRDPANTTKLIGAGLVLLVLFAILNGQR